MASRVRQAMLNYWRGGKAEVRLLNRGRVCGGHDPTRMLATRDHVLIKLSFHSSNLEDRGPRPLFNLYVSHAQEEQSKPSIGSECT